jgi:hypothetical protein
MAPQQAAGSIAGARRRRHILRLAEAAGNIEFTTHGILLKVFDVIRQLFEDSAYVGRWESLPRQALPHILKP